MNKLKKIVIINGVNQSGKDTFIHFVATNSDLTVKNISTVDKVKEAAVLLGWNMEKDELGRQALHDLKKLGNKYFNHAIRYVDTCVMTNEFDIMFVHCREVAEIEYFKRTYGKNCMSLLVHNDRVKVADNGADQDVYKVKHYDWVVYNGATLDDLKELAITFVAAIKDDLDK